MLAPSALLRRLPVLLRRPTIGRCCPVHALAMSSSAGAGGGGGGGGGAAKAAAASAVVTSGADLPQPLTAAVTTDMDTRADFINGQEYANYFCEYAKLYHQKQMLDDTPRMDAYYHAIMDNKQCFAGKVVLDMGSGTGVLAMWAAQAGASKVFAVEATPMARKARQLVEANGLSDIVEVIEAKVEEVELPCQVDIIVSEWMGYALLRESMLDSVIWARDKWLRPGGALFPSHASIGWGALSYDSNYQEQAEGYEAALGEWAEFKDTIKSKYGIALGVLDKAYRAENRAYYLENSAYSNLRSTDVLGANDDTVTYDLLSVTVEDLSKVRTKFTFDIESATATFRALGCWFKTDFRGSTENPCGRVVTLDTSPLAPETHWGQQVMPLLKPLAVRRGDVVEVQSLIERQKENQRMLVAHFQLTLTPGPVKEDISGERRKEIKLGLHTYSVP